MKLDESPGLLALGTPKWEGRCGGAKLSASFTRRAGNPSP